MMKHSKVIGEYLPQTGATSTPLSLLASDESVLGLVAAVYESFGLPGSTFVTRALQGRVSKKAKEARDIWIEETRLAKPRTVEIPEEDAAANSASILAGSHRGRRARESSPPGCYRVREKC